MPKFAAHEAKDGEQVKQWHDEAYAEYVKALAAFTKAAKPDQPSALMDKRIKARYDEARENLRAGVQYWREVGEQVGTRTGIAIEDNVIDVDPEDSE